MKIYRITLFLVAVFALSTVQQALAAPNTGQKDRADKISSRAKKLASGCAPATAQFDLDINNVRARILNGGDMWWDLVSTAKYEIPKVTQTGVSRRNVLFAGALWIGGFENNNLKIAAMTYRQNGSDFFPGPLDVTTASIDAGVCKNWDKIYPMTRAEIDLFKNDPSQMSEAIRNWPAHEYNGGSTKTGNHDLFMAPFVDKDGNGLYNPDGGDYPDVSGDQSLWYVYNDKGSNHSETGGDPIGLEVQEQAFAYATNDEINDMTFYKSIVINRSSNRLDSCYFGQWVDADLGYAFDDYVGVDVARSMGYCYNGENVDPGVTGYGQNPPSVGVDFFQGPKNDKGKELGLSKFVYYNNDFTLYGNPEKAIHYYYYLTGRWKNGTNLTEGGNGTTAGKATNYMFPGDPSKGLAGGWTELTAGNKFGDRRFIESSGSFSLKPGARNTVTVGVVYARASSGGATGSLDLLRLADDKAQKLYKNNFRLIDGPTAPDLTIRELDKKLIISLENTNTKVTEKYQDTVLSDTGAPIIYKFQGYQIYQLANSSVSASQLGQIDKARLIGQVDLKDGIKDLVNQVYDPTLSQYVPQKMVANAQDSGIKHTFVVTSDAFGNNNGALSNFTFYYYMIVAYANATNDVNEKVQYLSGRKNVIAYTAVPHKNAPEFGGSELHSDYGTGPEITRLEGMGNGGNVLDMTQASEDEILANGKAASVTYKGGHGPVNIKVYDPTRLQAAKYELRFIDSTILKAGGTPATGTILSMKDGKRWVFPQYGPNAHWKLTNLTTGEVINAESTLDQNNEQLLFSVSTKNGVTVRNSLGLSITTTQTYGPGLFLKDASNGFLQGSIVYSDPTNQWLDGVADVDHNTQLPDGTATPSNWIRAGKYITRAAYNGDVDDAVIDTSTVFKCDPNTNNPPCHANMWVDPDKRFGNILGGIIAPAAVVARSNNATALNMGPLPGTLAGTKFDYKFSDITGINSIDLVFTPDKSKWSNSIVLEMGEASGINQGGVSKFSLRAHDGWDGTVDNNGNPVYRSDLKGRSMFPGYAVNVETGQRLNIMFSEDSHLSGENGADMLWNPTANEANFAAGYTDYIGRWLYGGKHYIYIMNSVLVSYGVYNSSPFIPKAVASAAIGYDGCNSYYSVLSNPNSTGTDLLKVWASCMYVMEPMLSQTGKLAPLTSKGGIIPQETRIRIRVNKPYVTYNAGNPVQNNTMPLYNFSTDNISPARSTAIGSSALDMVNIVPNPYYASSLYETNQLDNRVRFTNLPPKCDISIYTLDGVLIRKFSTDNSSVTVSSSSKYPLTYLDWDLKNQKGVPVASGVYLIHVNGYELGEKVMKWFGILRPIDLDTF